MSKFIYAKEERNGPPGNNQSHFGRLATSWFGTSMMLFCATRRLVHHENTQRWMVHCYKGLKFYIFGRFLGNYLYVQSLPTLWYSHNMGNFTLYHIYNAQLYITYLHLEEAQYNQVNGSLGKSISSHFLVFVHPCTTEAATCCYTNYTMCSMTQTATYTDSWKQRLIVWGSNHIASKVLLAPYYIGGLTSQFHLIGSLITTKQKRTYRRGNFLCPTRGNGATSNNWTPQKLCFPSLRIQHLS